MKKSVKSLSNQDIQDLVEQVDESVHILVLVKGRLAGGKEHYAYVSIPPSRYQAFKEAEAKGNYDLAAYGTILHHGEGHEPSAEVKKKMEEEYGVQHRFEEELLKTKQKLYEVLFKEDSSA